MRIVPSAAVLALVALLPAAISAQGSKGQRLFDTSVVHSLKLRFSQTNWYAQLQANYVSKKLIAADVTLDGRVFKNVGVRFRGNSSYKAIGDSQKKPFKILLDAFVPGQSFDGVSTINLNNGFRDPTFVREILASEIFDKMMPSSRAAYVSLEINGQNWGPYISVEQINKDMLDRYFEDRSGNRYRAELRGGTLRRDSSALAWLGTNPALYHVGYELKSETPIKPYEDIRDLCAALNNGAASQLPQQLPPLLDVDEALRYLAGQNLLPAIDSYIGNVAHNYYLYREPVDGRFVLLPWDLNASFGGNAWLTVAQKTRLSPYYSANLSSRPLLRRMFLHAPWKARYVAYLRNSLEHYDWNKLKPRVAALQKSIEPYLRVDTKRLYSMALFTSNVTRDVNIVVNRRSQVIPGLEPLIGGRRAYLLAHTDLAQPVPALQVPTHTPLQPTTKDSVLVRATSIAGVSLTLHWQQRAGVWTELAMRDDGRSGDGGAGDGVYGATLPPLPRGTRVSYFVVARGANGAQAIQPALGGAEPVRYVVAWPRRASTLRINELLAKNSRGLRDEKREFEDWFELVNTGASTLDIGGMHLTDDPAKPKLWTIPPGTKILAGSTLLFWADDEPGDGPLHTTFKLAAEGESLWLFDVDGVHVLDEVAWGPQRADLSLGRLFDGLDPFLTWLDPTPARSNGGTCGIGGAAYRRYRAASPGAPGLVFIGHGTPKIGADIDWELRGGQPQTSALLFAGASPATIDVADTGLRIFAAAPWILAEPLPFDLFGNLRVRFKIPNEARWVGVRLYASALGLTPTGVRDSSGLETLICR